MTTGRDVARDESVARYRDWLVARGQPATPQRIAIATEALGAERPLSAEDLVERLRVRGPAPGVATVYRTLDALDRKSTRLNSSHSQQSRMPSSA